MLLIANLIPSCMSAHNVKHICWSQIEAGPALRPSCKRDEVFPTGNRNKRKGNGAGQSWESQSHCFADKFGKPYIHSFGTETHTWRFRPLYDTQGLNESVLLQHDVWTRPQFYLQRWIWFFKAKNVVNIYRTSNPRPRCIDIHKLVRSGGGVILYNLLNCQLFIKLRILFAEKVEKFAEYIKLKINIFLNYKYT